MKMISTVKKIGARLQSDGLSNFLLNTYRFVLPRRLEYYSQCQSFLATAIGLEIGGPSHIFGKWGNIPVYSIAAKIDNCNFGKYTVWEGDISKRNTFKFNRAKEPGRQYIAEASDLHCIENSSYDFLLSSHCIEHMANPLQGLSEWIRVVKNDGLLVLVFPHKDQTFDHKRPVTSLQHLIQDFDNKTGEDDMTHLQEILEFHDLSRDPGAGNFQTFEQRSKQNKENRCLHQHVFDTRLAVEVVNHMGLQILSAELFHPNHIVIIAKNIGRDHTVKNEKFRAHDAALYLKSPFPTDRATPSKN